MSLNILLVEDEPGIREGLASYLQLKGYQVVAVGSCAEGVAHVTDGAFELVITDWHLGDGLGEAIVRASSCPVIVVSGVAECVDVPGVEVEVIRKPVMPPDLVARIESMCAVADEAAPEVDVLPVDARDRVALIRALVRSRHETLDADFEVLDDGVYVTVRALLARDDDSLQEAMSRVGGDVRCLDRGGRPLLEVRFFRSSQRHESDILVAPDEPWPEGDDSIAVDFCRSEGCSPERFVELLHRARRVREAGRTAYLLNVPSHLRLHVELLGKAHAMPMREMAGPALPEILSELWR